jgi:hypothetical protein
MGRGHETGAPEDRNEKMVHATLDGQLAAGLIDNATYERLLNEALPERHAGARRSG